VLEELRTEKRILQAERDDALQRLLSIQSDLEDVSAMEQKVILETQKIEREVQRHRDDEEYVQTRGSPRLIRVDSRTDFTAKTETRSSGAASCCTNEGRRECAISASSAERLRSVISVASKDIS
jgi:hypothetical protein